MSGDDRTRTDRKRSFRQAGAGLSKALADTAARRGFAEPEVLLRWPEIVGADLAPLCRPVAISYGRGTQLGATLTLEVAGGRGPEIEASGPVILERINAHYGYRAVGRLKIRQLGPGGFSEAQAGFRGPEAPEFETSEAARNRAKALATGIRRPGLRAALERLGARVLSRQDRTTR
ncbi:MAG: DUF721 domain-containing protein [Pikeienuella sp.]